MRCHLGQQVGGFSRYVSQNQRGFLVQVRVLHEQRVERKERERKQVLVNHLRLIK